jgi:hypothetical protein
MQHGTNHAWSTNENGALCSRAGGLRVSMVKFLPSKGREFGLHWHNTLDFQWLFAAELTIDLDDGAEVALQPGTR